MALYTKKLIMATFQTMLEELPFDKITVAALVKRAGACAVLHHSAAMPTSALSCNF